MIKRQERQSEKVVRQNKQTHMQIMINAAEKCPDKRYDEAREKFRRPSWYQIGGKNNGSNEIQQG